MHTKRNLIVAALLVLVSLFVVATASAERGGRRGPGGHGPGPDGDGPGPCAEDVQRLCSDVEPGEGRIQECLASKASELSTECSEGIAKAQARHEEHRAKREAFKAACGADVERLCGESLGAGGEGGPDEGGPDAGPGKGKGHGKRKAIMECLSTHEAELSAECQAQTADAKAHHEARKAKHEAVKTACAADVQTFCADEAASAGEGKGKGKRHELFACMRQHERQLSGDCLSAIQSARPE